MKTVVGYLAGAAMVAAIGWGFLTASRLDRAIAQTERDLVALNDEEADATFEVAERYLGYAARLPWVGTGPVNDVRARRASLKYWQEAYAEIVPAETEPVAAVDPTNVGLQLVVANAVYRQALAAVEDRDSALAAVDAGINAYLTVLENDPQNADAAFNYEYLVRVRGQVEDGADLPGEQEGDEDGPMGQEGGPSPEQGAGEEFKIYIPLESEELDEGGGSAGKGAPPERKG